MRSYPSILSILALMVTFYVSSNAHAKTMCSEAHQVIRERNEPAYLAEIAEFQQQSSNFFESTTPSLDDLARVAFQRQWLSDEAEDCGLQKFPLTKDREAILSELENNIGYWDSTASIADIFQSDFYLRPNIDFRALLVSLEKIRGLLRSPDFNSSFVNLVGSKIRQIEAFASQALDKDFQDCEPIALPLKDFPVRDQGIAPVCWAYAAAELLSQKLGYEVSAGDLALQTYRNDVSRLDWQADGKPREALAKAKSFGVCQERDFHLAVLNDGNDGTIHASQLFSVLRTGQKDESFWQRRSMKSSINLLRQVFPNLEVDQIKTAIHAGWLSYSLDDEGLMSLSDRACGKRTVLPSLEVVTQDSATLMRVDQELKEGHVLALSFRTDYTNHYPAVRGNDSSHVAMLVRRYPDHKFKQCMYVFKNSWGKITSQGPMGSFHRDGFLYVPRSTLREALIGYSYLK